VVFWEESSKTSMLFVLKMVHQERGEERKRSAAEAVVFAGQDGKAGCGELPMEKAGRVETKERILIHSAYKG